MTDYWCGPGGDNGDDGLSRANYKATYAAIVSAYSPGAGDTVYLTASTGAGSSGTLAERVELRSGSSGSLFTLAVASGDTITVDVDTPGTEGAIYADGASYFEIVPGDGNLILGDITDWSASDHDAYTADRQLQLENCSNFQLIGTGTGNWATTNSNFVVHGGHHYFGNLIDICNLGYFQGIDFILHGTIQVISSPPGQLGDDWGDFVRIHGQTTRLYFYQCCLAEGGHNNVENLGHYIIFEECDFNGFHRAADDAGTTSEGNRAGDSSGGNESNGATSPWGPQLYQNCILRNTQSTSEQSAVSALKLETGHVIFRQNYIWDCVDRVFQSNAITDHGSSGSITRIKYYHNTAYNVGSICSIRSTTSGVSSYTGMYEHIDMLNNIFDQLGTPVFDRPYIWRQASNEQDDNSFGDDGWKGMRVNANIVNRSAAGDVDCRFDPISGGTETFNFDEGNTDYPAVFDANNVEGTAPTYSGTPGFPSFQRTKGAFKPNGGIETNAAQPIATANGAVTDSNTITLQDGEAYLFKDDWGMSSLGVAGDYVYLAEIDEIRQITSIDYANHQITIDGVTVVLSDNSAIYWVREDGVTKCRDIGAGQSAAVLVEEPPVTSRLVWIH